MYSDLIQQLDTMILPPTDIEAGIAAWIYSRRKIPIIRRAPAFQIESMRMKIEECHRTHISSRNSTPKRNRPWYLAGWFSRMSRCCIQS